MPKFPNHVRHKHRVWPKPRALRNGVAIFSKRSRRGSEKGQKLRVSRNDTAIFGECLKLDHGQALSARDALSVWVQIGDLRKPRLRTAIANTRKPKQSPDNEQLPKNTQNTTSDNKTKHGSATPKHGTTSRKSRKKTCQTRGTTDKNNEAPRRQDSRKKHDSKNKNRSKTRRHLNNQPSLHEPDLLTSLGGPSGINFAVKIWESAEPSWTKPSAHNHLCRTRSAFCNNMVCVATPIVGSAALSCNGCARPIGTQRASRRRSAWPPRCTTSSSSVLSCRIINVSRVKLLAGSGKRCSAHALFPRTEIKETRCIRHGVADNTAHSLCEAPLLSTPLPLTSVAEVWTVVALALRCGGDPNPMDACCGGHSPTCSPGRWNSASPAQMS